MKSKHEPGTEAWARDIQRPHVSRYHDRKHNPADCCASVADGGRSVGFHQCYRKPKVYYGSLGYCGTHDPAAVIAKREAWNAKYEAERLAKHKAWNDAKAEAALREAALEAIRQIAAGHNNPRGLAIDVLGDN